MLVAIRSAAPPFGRVVLSGTIPATATLGVPFTFTPTTTGGKPPITYSATGLPSGLTIDRSTGEISGTPSESGAFAVTITARDVVGQRAQLSGSIEVEGQALALTGTLADAEQGVAYSSGLTASGGVLPYTWSVTGSLPAGLTIDPATGVISGTPTEDGSFPITVRVEDSSDPPQIATSEQTIEVAAAASFPVLLSSTTSQQTSNQTTQPVQMPTTASGDLLIVSISNSNSTITNCATPSGWTLRRDAVSATLPRTWVFSRVADGTESGGTVNFVFSNNQRSVAVCHRIQAGTYSGAPEVSAWASGTGANPDPSSLSPSWGAASTLWLAIFHARYAASGVSVYPYPDGNTMIQNSSGLIHAASCWTESATASLDPGAYTRTSTTGEWMAATIAVQPA